jgi:hypothetical protein
MFIGKVESLRKCTEKYKYDDTHDDQRYWTTQFLEFPELITLDYENKMFLNTSGFNENLFIYNIDSQMAMYKAKSPLFVHVNGPEKSFINKLTGIEM